MKTFSEYIREHITDRLNEYEDECVYCCDLAYELTMEENMNGCDIMYTAEAKKHICEYWDYAADTFRYFSEELDMKPNPFENPCVYTFFMLDYGVREMLAQCAYLNENWNEQIILKRETIELIISNIEDITI